MVFWLITRQDKVDAGIRQNVAFVLYQTISAIKTATPSHICAVGERGIFV
jgi:hypothetical protein